MPEHKWSIVAMMRKKCRRLLREHFEMMQFTTESEDARRIAWCATEGLVRKRDGKYPTAYVQALSWHGSIVIEMAENDGVEIPLPDHYHKLDPVHGNEIWEIIEAARMEAPASG